MSADYDYMNADDMCPNCVTPWKCNGPHLTTWQNSTDNGTEMALRIAAFGAIRRAAKHARDCDLECPQSNGFVWRGDTPKSAAIRCAIRLAIGSDKA